MFALHESGIVRCEIRRLFIDDQNGVIDSELLSNNLWIRSLLAKFMYTEVTAW